MSNEQVVEYYLQKRNGMWSTQQQHHSKANKNICISHVKSNRKIDRQKIEREKEKECSHTYKNNTCFYIHIHIVTYEYLHTCCIRRNASPTKINIEKRIGPLQYQCVIERYCSRGWWCACLLVGNNLHLCHYNTVCIRTPVGIYDGWKKEARGGENKQTNKTNMNLKKQMGKVNCTD